MKIVCCKCDREIDEKRGEGIMYSYCDRCVAVAGLEIVLEKAETGERRARQVVEALDHPLGGSDNPLLRAKREAEFECWEDRVSEIKTKIAELNS
jgi:hypothetical protein